MDIYREIEKIRNGYKPAALCTVVHTKGSTPRKAGAKMLVFSNGDVIGTIGGGHLEMEVVENARNQIKENTAKLFKHDLLIQHDMCCGGTVEVFIEPIVRMKPLYIFGAGHTGKALAELASRLDFNIHVIDDRQEYLDQITVEGIQKINSHYLSFLSQIQFDDSTFIVIVTYEHAMDRDILAYCIRQPHAYLGMIGSERKVLITKKTFMDAGIATAEQLASVKMPIGKHISAETPDEIAISILAEIIEVKNTVCQEK